MKFILLAIIKLYWFVWPKSKRRNCIFKISCSNHVYTQTKSNGFTVGLNAFAFRYKNCRHGFSLYNNPVTGEIELLSATGKVFKSIEIADHLK
ncbi:MAG: membrane protein insertion efficiency factor YidD [Flavobacterium sp.]|nr:MAG: membrane protein insertion efficiency factor YidD [Flavobacterium sp.]